MSLKIKKTIAKEGVILIGIAVVSYVSEFISNLLHSPRITYIVKCMFIDQHFPPIEKEFDPSSAVPVDQAFIEDFLTIFLLVYFSYWLIRFIIWAFKMLREK